MTRVDLIIPTHNGNEWLERCLRSLALSTFRDYHLWVFDDASDPPAQPVVDRLALSGTVIRVDQNVGLARAFNIAIAHGSATYVVLLNNDTEVEPTWLETLVDCADRHPRAGSVASKLRLLSDRRKLHSAGDYYSVRGMPGNRGVWLDDFGQFDTEEEIFGACGGAALYRRSSLDDIALRPGVWFDERLFMYCEDVDLAWRLQRRGWSCIFAPDAVVYHALSATAGGPLASYYVARNVWLLLGRSIPSDVLRPYRHRILAYHLGRIMRSARHIRHPAARATLRGTAVGLVTFASHRTPPRLNDSRDIERLRALLVR